jgi:hypothetical protein
MKAKTQVTTLAQWDDAAKSEIKGAAIGDVKLTRFRGHPTFWVEGVHDVEAKTTLPS